jgi:hypothetical protein
MKWTWVLVGLAVLLLVFGVREGFDTYAQALADSGQAAGVKGADGTVTGVGNANSSSTARPSQGQTGSSTNPIGEGPNPNAAPGLVPTPDYPTLALTLSDCEYTASKTGTVSTACKSLFDAANVSLPTCPTGSTYSADTGNCINAAGKSTPGVCPTGMNISFTHDNMCVPSPGWAQPPAGPAKLPSGGAGAQLGAGAGGGLGGGFGGGGGTLLTPSSGQNILGPVFAGVGTNGNYNGYGDGSTPPSYPYMFGPTPSPSTLVPGAGMAGPSQAWNVQAGMPSYAQSGSALNSKYFGTSRVPGDQNIVPGTQYSTSSGSSKTEPIPFLTDFSAFSR